MSSAANNSGSMLIVSECFEQQEARFIEELRRVKDRKALAAFADRWRKDHRPWARQQQLEYLDLPFDCHGQQPVVKRLFKQAEAIKDHELVGAFLVAFDRLVRKKRRTCYRWDWETRQSWQEEELVTPVNSFLLDVPQKIADPYSKRTYDRVWRQPRNARLFRHRTRYYLRRRAWRYFRWLGYGTPDEYPTALAHALIRYRDEDVAKGEDLLECWGLMHACYHQHPSLVFHTTTIQVREGFSLAQLTPSPRFPDLWRRVESFPVLMNVATVAKARLIRLWAIELLRREHASQLRQMPVEQIISLLDHDQEEIVQFGAELLEQSQLLAALPIDTWLRLLQTQNPTALATICSAMIKNVAGDRLTLPQCVMLASTAPSPVARLGFDFLRQRSIRSPQDRQLLVKLADAKCGAIAFGVTQWALQILGSNEHYDRDLVTPFLDSLLAESRDAAWQWLVDGLRGYNDPGLWSRLLETPYDDLRLRIIDELQRRSTLPGASRADLAPLWCTVLLGVHRGGRQKRKALDQLTHAIVERPELASSLLPILIVAVRSLRPPEMRAGLTAAVRVLAACPTLAEAFRQQLPELQFIEKESA